MRDGIGSGFSLISRRNHDPRDPPALRPAIPRSSFTAVIYPVVKVHRRSGSASAGLVAVVRSSCPLVGELCVERTDQGTPGWVPDTRRRLEDQPANRRASGVVGPGGRPGAETRSYSIVRLPGYPGPEEVLRLTSVVETRRLELLTLSLQRRCSSS